MSGSQNISDYNGGYVPKDALAGSLINGYNPNQDSSKMISANGIFQDRLYETMKLKDFPALETLGGNQPHDNLSPYVVISIWKRIV